MIPLPLTQAIRRSTASSPLALTLTSRRSPSHRNARFFQIVAKAIGSSSHHHSRWTREELCESLVVCAGESCTWERDKETRQEENSMIERKREMYSILNFGKREIPIRRKSKNQSLSNWHCACTAKAAKVHRKAVRANPCKPCYNHSRSHFQYQLPTNCQSSTLCHTRDQTIPRWLQQQSSDTDPLTWSRLRSLRSTPSYYPCSKSRTSSRQ